MIPLQMVFESFCRENVLGDRAAIHMCISNVLSARTCSLYIPFTVKVQVL